MEMYDGACPYMTDACYPIWKVDEADCTDPEKSGAAATPVKGETGILETPDETETRSHVMDCDISTVVAGTMGLPLELGW
jgi:hypothetical protein